MGVRPERSWINGWELRKRSEQLASCRSFPFPFPIACVSESRRRGHAEPSRNVGFTFALLYRAESHPS